MAFDFNSDPTLIITVYKCHQKQQIIEDTRHPQTLCSNLMILPDWGLHVLPQAIMVG